MNVRIKSDGTSQSTSVTTAQGEPLFVTKVAWSLSTHGKDAELELHMLCVPSEITGVAKLYYDDLIDQICDFLHETEMVDVSVDARDFIADAIREQFAGKEVKLRGEPE